MFKMGRPCCKYKKKAVRTEGKRRVRKVDKGVIKRVDVGWVSHGEPLMSNQVVAMHAPLLVTTLFTSRGPHVFGITVHFCILL